MLLPPGTAVCERCTHDILRAAVVFMSLPGPLIEKMNCAITGDGRAGKDGINLLSNSIWETPIIIIPVQDDFTHGHFAAEVTFRSDGALAGIAQKSYVRLVTADACEVFPFSVLEDQQLPVLVRLRLKAPDRCRQILAPVRPGRAYTSHKRVLPRPPARRRSPLFRKWRLGRYWPAPDGAILGLFRDSLLQTIHRASRGHSPCS